MIGSSTSRWPFFLAIMIPGCAARMHSAMALWFLGYSQKAVERSRTGIAMARELSHIGTLVNELPFAGIIHQLRREAPAVREIAESLIVLSTEHGFPQWLAFGKVLDSWAQAEQVDDVGLVAQLRGAIGNYRAQKRALPSVLSRAFGGDRAGHTRKLTRASATVSKALEMTERTGLPAYGSRAVPAQGGVTATLAWAGP